VRAITPARSATPGRQATPGRENSGVNIARRAESPATPTARPPRRAPLGIPGGTPVSSYPRTPTLTDGSPAESQPTSRWYLPYCSSPPKLSEFTVIEIAPALLWEILLDLPRTLLA